jgi:CHAT domain-containing protein
MIRSLLSLAAFTAVLATSSADADSLGLSDSFRIGNSGVLCTAQSRLTDDRLKSMFDRGYAIVCRDAASAVGHLYALRVRKNDAQSRLYKPRDPQVSCDAPLSAALPDLPGAQRSSCRASESGLGYTVYTAAKNGFYYTAEGLAAYDVALKAGLLSLALDHVVPADIAVATTDAGDPAAFARVQAGNLNPDQALSEGYVRNNEGSFAESAEFFETLVTRNRSGNTGFVKSAEYLANQALQQSNLGNFPEATRLFAQVARVADPSEPLIGRMLRNFQAIHLLNQREAEKAFAVLQRPVPGLGSGLGALDRVANGYIDSPMAARLSVDDDAMIRLGGASSQLTVPERAALFDAQAGYLRGAALRLQGKRAEARTALTKAVQALAVVRNGTVQSMSWLQAASLSELSSIAEADGNAKLARASLDEAVKLYGRDYPGSAARLSAQARLAGLLARSGDSEAARNMFQGVVAATPVTPGGGAIIRPLLRPYFDLLSTRSASDQGAAADFFAASQVLLRPGVAQTQALFARELSGGSDEAANLFRQSVTLSREIVRTDAEIAGLAASTTPADLDKVQSAQLRRQQLGIEQTIILARLAAFPRFRVLTNPVLALSELQKRLGAGDAYYKLVLVRDAAYGLVATRESAQIVRVGASVAELEAMTAQIRDSISKVEGGQRTTYPFDVAVARRLYVALFGALDARMPSIKHLIFEPDGPLLQLPVNLLVAEQSGVDAYAARIAKPDADEFDFTGIAWLGRARMVSTAVSAQAFVDVRTIAPSKATKRYLGLGNNAPALRFNAVASSKPERDSCDWPLTQWASPISAAELRLGAATLGGIGNEVLTGAAFTDTVLRDRKDLADFRILHFATHGLVTAPRPECPARPALVTSFGLQDSDGLLSFREIFDLHLDADTIILSACDTAGAATVAATREAGVATGGNFALDGLVRAFVGAGARSVIASHWPVPDDFDATKKLMSGMFSGGSTASIGEALRQSQIKLMDDPVTSHPYYWSGFAIVGDADKPIIGRESFSASN